MIKNALLWLIITGVVKHHSSICQPFLSNSVDARFNLYAHFVGAKSIQSGV